MLCQVCGGAMKVLFHPSWYCPNDCDWKTVKTETGYQLVERRDGRKWRVEAIYAGEVVPEWAKTLCWVSYLNYTPDRIKDCVHDLDRAWNIGWGVPNLRRGTVLPDYFKEHHWMLALAPES